jgi:PAS domain S-box-containing protein
MRLTLSRKILAVFLSLTLVTLALGGMMLGSMSRLRSLHDQIEHLKEFELQLNRLESLQLQIDPVNAAEKRKEFDAQVAVVRAMIATLRQEQEHRLAEKEFHRRLDKIEAYIGHYQRAGYELIAACERDSIFRREVPALQQEVFPGLVPLLQAQGRRNDAAAVVNFLAIQDQAHYLRDPAALGKLRRIHQDLERSLGLGRPDQALLAPLQTLLAKSEANYLDYLEGLDRRSFLKDTAEHCFLFSRQAIADFTRMTRDIQEGMVLLIGGFVLFAILLTLVLWHVSARYVNRFLNGQRLAIEAIENGSYDYELPPPSRDELGDLSLFMKRMALRLQLTIRQLTRSEEKHRALIETTDTGFVILDLQGVVLDVNGSYLLLTGRSEAGEVIGHHVLEWTAPAHRQATEEALALCLEKGGVRNLIVEYGGDSGPRLPVEINATVVGTEEGAAIMVLCRDISERRQAEEALAAEKERLAVTLRSIGDGVISTDVEGRVLFLNRVAEELTGWRQHEAVGKLLTEVFRIINEKTRQPCENPVEKVLATGQIVGLANHTALIARDGRQRSIADSGAPIRDSNSRVIGVVLVFRDVTGQYRMEEELFKAKKLEAVGVLAGGIAHDFNNLLTAILGNLSLVGIGLPAKEERLRLLLEEAEKASIRARDLTGQLLTFAKGGSPVRKAADIASVIRDSAEFVLHGSNCACHYDFCEDLWLVDIDSGQISRVIQNIVLNAMHVMPGGGVIAVRGRNVEGDTGDPAKFLAGGRYVRIDISDSGPGVPAHLQDRIFDPYFTTKQEGSGLGLAIVHSIIRRHSGHVSATSVPGQGTTFTFCLPAASRKTEEQNAVPALSALPALRGSGPILVMDDEAVIREMLARMLGMQGFVVTGVENGEQALEHYRRAREEGAPYAAVILDLTIPGGMGGREAAGQLLAMDPGARLIVSSGYSNDPIMAEFAQHGFRDAVAKPYRMQELLQSLQRVLADQEPATNSG